MTRANKTFIVTMMTVVVFRHVNEYKYVLRYPCCESFINRGFCAQCISSSEGEGISSSPDDIIVNVASHGGRFLPYLLYIGKYTRNVELKDLPVCHIDVNEAQRIIKNIWNHERTFITVLDTKGHPHVIDINQESWVHRAFQDYWLYRVVDVLSYYVTSVLALAIRPVSPLHRIEHLRWELHNRGCELLDVTHAMTCRTLSGRKRTWGWRSRDRQIHDLKHLACEIKEYTHDIFYDTQCEAKNRILKIESAFK